jgi:uncharacterized protein YcbK (DUF882 family)
MDGVDFFAWRRRLLVAAGATLCAPAAATSSRAPEANERLRGLLAERRSLWIVRGQEELRAIYWTPKNGYDRDQYLSVCWALRDLQANRVFPIDHGLLDVLAGVQVWLARNGIEAPLTIHSGYRTQKTNKRTEGAALDSRHLLGRAADISVQGVSNVKLAGMASVLSQGGTGLYPGRTFVHVDTGDERIWIDRPVKPG